MLSKAILGEEVPVQDVCFRVSVSRNDIGIEHTCLDVYDGVVLIDL